MNSEKNVEKPSRVLGVDLGTKRVGIAISDPAGVIAFGLDTIDGLGRAELIARLGEIVEERSVGKIVLGHPLNMDSTSGPKAKEAEAFAAELGKAVGVEVELFDERLSTRVAEAAQKSGGLTRKKRKKSVDRMAAQVILQGYLDRASRQLNTNENMP